MCSCFSASYAQCFVAAVLWGWGMDAWGVSVVWVFVGSTVEAVVFE